MRGIRNEPYCFVQIGGLHFVWLLCGSESIDLVSIGYITRIFEKY